MFILKFNILQLLVLWLHFWEHPPLFSMNSKRRRAFSTVFQLWEHQCLHFAYAWAVSFQPILTSLNLSRIMAQLFTCNSHNINQITLKKNLLNFLFLPKLAIIAACWSEPWTQPHETPSLLGPRLFADTQNYSNKLHGKKATFSSQTLLFKLCSEHILNAHYMGPTLLKKCYYRMKIEVRSNWPRNVRSV